MCLNAGGGSPCERYEDLYQTASKACEQRLKYHVLYIIDRYFLASQFRVMASLHFGLKREGKVLNMRAIGHGTKSTLLHLLCAVLITEVNRQTSFITATI
jgi:hypothetical protein